MKVEKHGYMFTDKDNSKGGEISTVLSVLALVLIVAGIAVSYKKSGNAGIETGFLGTGSFIMSSAGLIIGLRSFKEKDKFYVFSWIGTLANGVIWIAVCSIIAMGIMIS